MFKLDLLRFYADYLGVLSSHRETYETKAVTHTEEFCQEPVLIPIIGHRVSKYKKELQRFFRCVCCGCSSTDKNAPREKTIRSSLPL